ncbi:MAG: FecR domain-containing protein [Sedimenticola sp.]|nr:FecR domain-containing protein [Sedimenticola sp.]
MDTTGRKKNLLTGLAALCLLLFSSASLAQEWVYTVVPGDNLWNFCEKYLYKVGYWKQLQQINGIKNPRRMQPGTRVRVPMAWIRVNAAQAELAAIQGEVWLMRADGTRRVVVAGERIGLGDSIETGTDSSAAIRFADRSLMTLHANSLIRFDHLSAYGETGMVDSRLRLQRGRSDNRVTPASGPGSRFEIHTPSAISAVRGTEYRLSSNPAEQASTFEVLEGRVKVSGEQRSELLPAHFGTRVEAGEPPLPPRELLPAPRIEALPQEIEQLNWPITWQAAEGAVAYRAEIARDASFITLLWEQRVTAPRVPLPDLPDGEYHFRVRGIDDIGLEGLNRAERFILDARPQPPVPLSPANRALFRGKQPTLQWSDSEDAANYRLQIARDPAFKRLLTDQEGVEGTRFDAGAFGETGDYYWRLYSISDSGEQGPAGDTRSWQVKPIPDRPETGLEVTDSEIITSWRPGVAGQSYRVQLASDPTFESLLLDESLDQPSWRLQPVSGQMRYFRVRYVEPDGYEGPWGATQRIEPAPDNSWIYTLGAGLLGILLL